MTQHVSFIIRLILVLDLIRKMAWGDIDAIPSNFAILSVGFLLIE